MIEELTVVSVKPKLDVNDLLTKFQCALHGIEAPEPMESTKLHS